MSSCVDARQQIYSSYMCSTTHFVLLFIFFFFNDTSTTEIYTLSLHDALPISFYHTTAVHPATRWQLPIHYLRNNFGQRSEEHTSELQSHSDLVCRLLLEKKKKKEKKIHKIRNQKKKNS